MKRNRKRARSESEVEIVTKKLRAYHCSLGRSALKQFQKSISSQATSAPHDFTQGALKEVSLQKYDRSLLNKMFSGNS